MFRNIIQSIHFLILAGFVLYCGNKYVNSNFEINERINATISSEKWIVDYISDQIASKWALGAAVILVGIYISKKIHKVIFGKSIIIIQNDEGQVGHLLTPGKSRKDILNMAQERKKVGEIPPVYPNGWYEVILSQDLPVGSVKAVNMVGKHLVVFRKKDGRVCVMDAYCPHLGANLGVGGQVIGNCIKCPFHGWEFDGETGECKNVPYSTKVPGFAKIKVWHSIERNGIVTIWYDAEGREPSFFIEDIPQIKSGKWSYRGCCVHYLNCHIQDLIENAADSAHFKTIHEPAIGGGSDVDFLASDSNWLNKILRVHTKVNWKVLPPPDSHIGYASIDSHYTFLNKFVVFKVHADLHQVGPGFLNTTVILPFAEGIFILTFVPEGPLKIRLTSHLYFDWWMPAFMAHNMIHNMATQIDRDALIWNNKTHNHKPLLMKEDDGIQALRRWFSQFYSENSPRLTFKKEDLEW